MRLAALAFAALITSAAVAAAGPMARATWSFPNGPGIMLGAAPGGVGLDVAVAEWSPYVAVQGEWEAGRVDAGLAGNVDFFLPLAGWGVSGSVMKSWSSESTYAGARAWIREGVLSISAGLYERFHGDSGDYRVVTAGIGLGYR
jgi:hypothetical protein